MPLFRAAIKTSRATEESCSASNARQVLSKGISVSAVKVVLAVSLFGMLLAGCQRSASKNSQSDASAYLPAGAILPSEETIKSGEYKPLSRPLFLYVNKKALERPVTRMFLDYFLSEEGRQLVSESGYISLSNEEYDQQVQILKAAFPITASPADQKLTGEVMIDGSSTVAPISTAVAEEFSKAHSDVRVPVGTSGTGGGFKKFCAGEIDICDASRGIKESEVELCRKAGIEYLELRIGLDGLTIVVNPQNHWVSGLTIADLEKIWNPDSTVRKWSDIRPEFPDAEIKLFGPDTDSGTFEYFTEEVCHQKGASRSDYQQSADDNFLVTGVAHDEHALGYFGFAYYFENKDKLKALAIAP